MRIDTTQIRAAVKAVRKANAEYGPHLQGVARFNLLKVLGGTAFLPYDDAAKARYLDTLETLCDATEGLGRALKNLLADTQHADHNCGEAGCPVDEARDALHMWASSRSPRP